MKEIRVNEFQNFNQIIEIYLKTLDVFSNSRNGKFDKEKMEELASLKYRFSLVAIQVISEFTKIENLYENKNINEERWNRRTNKYKLDPPFLGVNINGMPKNDNSLESFIEKFRNIRNCIAHGRYYLLVNNENEESDVLNNCFIVFDDPTNTVQGRISFNSLYNLTNEFTFIDRGDSELLDVDKSYIPGKNPDSYLTECFNNITLTKNNLHKKRRLSKEEKNKLKTYSALIGKKEMMTFFSKYISKRRNYKNVFNVVFIQKMNNLIKRIIYNGDSSKNILSENEFTQFLASIYSVREEELSESLYSATQFEITEKEYISIPLQLMMKNVLSQISKRESLCFEREMLYLNRPFLYNESLISLTNYIVGYIRECNFNYNKEVFKFSDIDVSNIKIDYEDPSEPSIEEVNPTEKMQKTISHKEKMKNEKKEKIKELLRKSSSKKGILNNILTIANNNSVSENDIFYIKINELIKFVQLIKQSNTEELDIDNIVTKFEQYASFLKQYENNIKVYPRKMIDSLHKEIEDLKQNFIDMDNISKDLSILKFRQENDKEQQPYMDYSGLFGHLRNAIVHSHVTVNFDKAKRTRNFEDIEYTFEDYKKNDPNWITFKATIKAKDLLNLIRSLQSSINSQIEQSRYKKKFETYTIHQAIVDLGINYQEFESINIEDIEKNEMRKGTEQYGK